MESSFCSVTFVDVSATVSDEVTGDKRSSQLRSYELKVKSLQQDNESLTRVRTCNIVAIYKVSYNNFELSSL